MLSFVLMYGWRVLLRDFLPFFDLDFFDLRRERDGTAELSTSSTYNDWPAGRLRDLPRHTYSTTHINTDSELSHLH